MNYFVHYKLEIEIKSTYVQLLCRFMNGNFVYSFPLKYFTEIGQPEMSYHF